MMRYRKGAAPKELAKVASTPGASWSVLGGVERTAIRKALLRDQGALCAYCERRITDAEVDAAGRVVMKIEHWLARADHEDEQLKWTNLLGGCDGGGPQGSRRMGGVACLHCDASRGRTALFLHPVDGHGSDPAVYLRYTRDGYVEADDARAKADITTLQLNAPHLVRSRAEIFALTWQRLAATSFRVQALRQEQRDHQLQPGTLSRSHATFVRYHLAKKLRQKGEVP